MARPRPGSIVAFRLPNGTPNAGQVRPAVIIRYVDPPADPNARADLHVLTLVGDSVGDAADNVLAAARDQGVPHASGTWWDP